MLGKKPQYYTYVIVVIILSSLSCTTLCLESASNETHAISSNFVLNLNSSPLDLEPMLPVYTLDDEVNPQIPVVQSLLTVLPHCEPGYVLVGGSRCRKSV